MEKDHDAVAALEAAGLAATEAVDAVKAFDADTEAKENALKAGQAVYATAEQAGDLRGMEAALDTTILPLEAELARRARLRTGLENVAAAKATVAAKAAVHRDETQAASHKAAAREVAGRLAQAARIFVATARDLEDLENKFYSVSQRAKVGAERVGLGMPQTGKMTVSFASQVRPWRQEVELWIQVMEADHV